MNLGALTKGLKAALSIAVDHMVGWCSLNPVSPIYQSAWFQILKSLGALQTLMNCFQTSSHFAFNFNLRPYSMAKGSGSSQNSPSSSTNGNRSNSRNGSTSNGNNSPKISPSSASRAMAVGGSTVLGGITAVQGVDPNAAQFQWSRLSSTGGQLVIKGATRHQYAPEPADLGWFLSVTVHRPGAGTPASVLTTPAAVTAPDRQGAFPSTSPPLSSST